MSFLDDFADKVSNTWHDVTAAGAPAIIAGVESYVAAQLTQSARENQAASQRAVQQAVQSGSPATGVMASIQQSVSGIAQNTFMKQYGGFIMIGAAALVVVGIVMASKR